jgi:hypothetical protein
MVELNRYMVREGGGFLGSFLLFKFVIDDDDDKVDCSIG